jgi:hypothetical protein
MTESQSFTASSAISLGSAVNDNNLQSQLAILDRQRQILVNTRANAAQGADAGDETNENQVGSESASASSILKRAKAAEAKVDMLKRQLIQALQANNAGGSPGAVGESAGEPQVDAAGAAIGAAGAKGKVVAPTRGRGGGGADPAEVRKMQRQIKELETRLQAAESGGGIDKKAAAAAEKAQAKKLKDLENSFRKEKAALESRAIKAEGALEAAAASLPLITEERDALRAKVMEMGTLREQAGRAVELAQNLKDKEGELVVLQEQFKKETFLRKKYKNELEDLKGNIRVYARCRPFAQYELDRKCAACVTFPDDSTVKVVTSRGEKVFEFDTAFTPTSTQTEVFEDTKRLVESCIDGYNVCLFAYGQTGVCRSIYFVGV